MRSFLICLLAASAIAAPSTVPRFRRGMNRIVGGEDVTPGEIPWQVSFQDVGLWIEGFAFCAGSVYNERWVITAGHCVKGENLDNPLGLQIVAGEHTLHVAEGHEQTIRVVHITLHDDYNANDIALLKLETPLVFNDYVAPIALPAVQNQEDYGVALISGWGATSEGGSPPDVLQKVSIPIVSDEECRKDYEGHDVLDSMICAGRPEGGVDSCQGDSGGPMVCDFDSSPYLCGIVSWGLGCARPGYPGVYTQVSYYRDWVISNAH